TLTGRGSQSNGWRPAEGLHRRVRRVPVRNRAYCVLPEGTFHGTLVEDPSQRPTTLPRGGTMSPADHELTRLLARTSLGERLMAVDADLRKLVIGDVFEELDPDARRRLERLLAEAGGRALYAFLVPYLEAVAAFVEEHREVELQADRYPAPT